MYWSKVSAVSIGLLLILITPYQATSSSIFSGELQSQEQDYWPTDGWQLATPEEQGMNSTFLDQMEDYTNTWPVDGMVVIRNGYIVYESYPNPEYNETTTHAFHSVVKSITSILVGIAIEDGNISSVNDNLISYFSNRSIANLDSEKESITLEHILTMTSGIEWFGDSTSIMKQQSDWVQYILDRPMAHAPGEVWNYCSGPHLFSAILNMTTGVSSKTYADTYLFQPLGIDHYDWMVDPQGLIYGAGELSMRLRDIAKIGLLHLNNGTWDGEQIVPVEWVVNSSRIQSTGGSSGQMSGQYGYLWWIKPTNNARFGFGRDGQYLWVLPDYDTVVVFTSESMKSYEYLITQFILPALGEFSQMVNTTTSETTTLTEQPFDVPLVIGIGVSMAIVIVLVVFMKKR